MHEMLQNIVGSYSLEEINNLETLLRDFKEKKLKDLELSPTLEKFFLDYSEYVKCTFSDKYLSSVKSSFKHLLLYFGPECLIKAISIQDVEKLKADLAKKAPSGYIVYMKTLKASFNYAMEWGLIDTNPFSKIKFKKKQSTKPVFITKEELGRIKEHISNNTINDIVSFSFFTGCRLGEVINLRWEQIDFTKDLITIGSNNFQTKNSKSRIIPIADELRIILKSRVPVNKNSNRYVFNKPNAMNYHKDYVSSKFKEAARAAGMDASIHFHTLRHSFASNLANEGVPIIAIKELMGHSDIATTQIYSHTNLDSLQRAIEKFNI